jgi:hypothetical protein
MNKVELFGLWSQLQRFNFISPLPQTATCRPKCDLPSRCVHFSICVIEKQSLQLKEKKLIIKSEGTICSHI